MLLGWPGVTQWPLGLLRSTHVYSEEKELRYSMQPGGSEPSLMPNQTYRLFQPRINYGVTCYEFDPTYKVRWTETCIWEESNICFESRQTYFLSFLWVRLRLTQRWVDYDLFYFILFFLKGGGGYPKLLKLNLQQKANILKGFVQTSYYCLIHFFKRVCLTNLLTHACL